jgi:hypothetical protein
MQAYGGVPARPAYGSAPGYGERPGMGYARPQPYRAPTPSFAHGNAYQRPGNTFMSYNGKSERGGWFGGSRNEQKFASGGRSERSFAYAGKAPKAFHEKAFKAPRESHSSGGHGHKR